MLECEIKILISSKILGLKKTLKHAKNTKDRPKILLKNKNRLNYAII
jgi:hypothetical protein